jgi:hypothetical protein
MICTAPIPRRAQFCNYRSVLIDGTSVEKCFSTDFTLGTVVYFCTRVYFRIGIGKWSNSLIIVYNWKRANHNMLNRYNRSIARGKSIELRKFREKLCAISKITGAIKPSRC